MRFEHMISLTGLTAASGLAYALLKYPGPAAAIGIGVLALVTAFAIGCAVQARSSEQ